jgi:hypothetical protein
MYEPRDRLDCEPDGEHGKHGAVDRCTQRLGALEPVGHRAARWARCKPQGDEPEHDRARVGEHVPGVGQQRDGPGDQARDDLHNHQPTDERERHQHRPTVRVGGDRVVMVMSVAHCPLRVVWALYATR